MSSILTIEACNYDGRSYSRCDCLNWCRSEINSKCKGWKMNCSLKRCYTYCSDGWENTTKCWGVYCEPKGCSGSYYYCEPCSGGCGGGGGGGDSGPVIVSCKGCSKTYRFTYEKWKAYDSCSGSRVSGSTSYKRDCTCSMYKNNNLLACYPNENYDLQCSPLISKLELTDSTGFKEVPKQKTTKGEEFYVSLYQRFRIPGSQALIQYAATRAVNCSLNCDYLSLDYIQEGIGPEYLPYACNTDANGNVSFIEDKLYSGEKASFKVSPQYRGLIKYNLTCYGPEGGPKCGHTDPYKDTKTIYLALYDYTYREVSPNEIINQIDNQLASISQIINQNLKKLKEIVSF